MPHQNNTIWKLLYSTKEAIQKTRTSEDTNSTKRARYSSYNIAHFERFQIICFVTSLSLRICQAFSECCYLYLKIWSKKLSLSMSKDPVSNVIDEFWFVSCFVDLLNDEPLPCFIIIYFLPFFCLLLSQLQAGGRFLDQLERTGSRNWNNRTALREPKVHQIPHFSQRSMERRQYFQLQASRNSSILDTSKQNYYTEIYQKENHFEKNTG